MRALPTIVVLVALAAAPPPAGAAVTTSAVTTPAAGTELRYDDQSAPPGSVTVTGTTNGVSGDTLQLYCDDGGSSRQFVGGVFNSVSFDGKFSVTVALSAFADAGGPCRLRAVPSGFVLGSGNPAPFLASPIIVRSVRRRFPFSAGPNAGATADWAARQQGTAGGAEYDAITECGLCRATLFDPITFTSSDALWSGNGQVFPVDSGPKRSYLKVDGRNALAPGYDLSWGDATSSRSLPGLEPIELSFADEPAPDGVMIRERAHFARCTTATDPTWPPPTKASCPGFQRTGVRVDRTVVQSSEGTEITIVDRWTSEDGQAHDLDLHYDQYVAGGPAGPSYRFAWVDAGYAKHPAGFVVPAPPSAPATWFVAADAAAPDGSTRYPQGALTVDPVPDATVFRSAGDPLLAYRRTVPAGGELVITEIFQMASTRAAVAAAATAAEQRLTPPAAPPGGPPAGGGPPAPTPAAPAAARPRITLAGRLRVRRTTLLVPLACVASPGARCRGRIDQTTVVRVLKTKHTSARERPRARTLVVASTDLTLGAGLTRTVSVPLPLAARRRLSASRRLTVTATILDLGAAATVRVAARRVTYRASRQRVKNR